MFSHRKRTQALALADRQHFIKEQTLSPPLPLPFPPILVLILSFPDAGLCRNQSCGHFCRARHDRHFGFVVEILKQSVMVYEILAFPV